MKGLAIVAGIAGTAALGMFVELGPVFGQQTRMAPPSRWVRVRTLLA